MKYLLTTALLLTLGTSVSINAKEMDGKKLFKKCVACHGEKAEKKALGKSGVVAKLDEKTLNELLKGYKKGEINKTGMGALMKVQVSTMDDEQINVLSKYIVSLNSVKKEDVLSKYIVSIKDINSKSIKSGQKVYLKKLKSKCKFAGDKMSMKHTQKEWKDIYESGKLQSEMEKECPKFTKKLKFKHERQLFDFLYEYGSDSGNKPSCG